MADERPNIILISTDQQRYDTIAELGFSYMDTPVQDRLVREGVSFDNCFITAPLCVSARASLFSGYYPQVMRDWLVRSNFKTRDWLTDWR